MELLLNLLSLSQWNRVDCRGYLSHLKPHLCYTITVESSKLNTSKISHYQIKLYQKICELRFDENLTWKQVADRLNQMGWKASRGGKNCDGTVCSTYFKIRKHFERKHKYFSPDLDEVELIWE